MKTIGDFTAEDIKECLDTISVKCPAEVANQLVTAARITAKEGYDITAEEMLILAECFLSMSINNEKED